LGENGTGKSTLIKVLSGAYSKDEGEIFWEGQPTEIKGPQDAQQLGISTIYQEFNLAPHLTIAENVFLGHLPKKGPLVDWATAEQRLYANIILTIGVVSPTGR
jgi:ribose transport system ATP-binding protein